MKRVLIIGLLSCCLLISVGCQKHTEPSTATPALEPLKNVPVTVHCAEKTVTGILCFGGGEPFRLEITSAGPLQGLTVTDGSSTDRFCFSYRTLYWEDLLLPPSSPVYLLYRAVQTGLRGTDALSAAQMTYTVQGGRIAQIAIPREDFSVCF